MEYRNITVIHGEDCEEPRIKEEHSSSFETTTESETFHVQQNESHIVQCIQSSDVDTKVGILEETWDPNVAPCDIKSYPNQSSTCLDIGVVKHDDEIDIKEEYLIQEEVSPASQRLHFQQYETHFMEYNVRVDVDTKFRIKQETWDPNGVSSDIKCDPEQHPILDPVQFTDTATIKGDDEIDIKEQLWCEETSADSLNDREASGLKKNEAAENVFSLESLRPHTDTVYSFGSTQQQENKETSSLSAKPNTYAQKCVTKHRCETCEKSFKRLTHLKKHFLVHDDNRPYKCQICGKTFKQLTDLKIHHLVHDDSRPYKCQICEKSFKRLGDLKSHLLVHDDRRQYKCQICEKSFNHLHNLKSHLSVHNDTRQFKCQLCEKHFKQLRALKTHLLVHDDKRYYKCQICEKSFKQVGALKLHLLVHEEKRLYKCKICEKSYKHLRALKEHLLLHEEKWLYKCQICEKSFKLLRGLKSHLLVHEEKRQYKCQTCLKSYKHKSSLKTHLLVHDNKTSVNINSVPKV